MLSHGKGAAFFPHLSRGVLGAHQKLSIDLTACANMWGEYWDSLICTVSVGGQVPGSRAQLQQEGALDMPGPGSLPAPQAVSTLALIHTCVSTGGLPSSQAPSSP